MYLLIVVNIYRPYIYIALEKYKTGEISLGKYYKWDKVFKSGLSKAF